MSDLIGLIVEGIAQFVLEFGASNLPKNRFARMLCYIAMVILAILFFLLIKSMEDINGFAGYLMLCLLSLILGVISFFLIIIVCCLLIWLVRKMLRQ